MGYPDGYYYGQGRIICDTSTFSVGDTIRVRSVYNALQTEDKQVVTVGTPLIFTVPPYDYYKICRVQTINDTPTEIGGEYVEIGFGDLHRSNVLDKTTLRGWKSIVNAHSEADVLSVGDEVDITVGNSPWTMLNAGMGIYHAHDILLVSKYLYTTGGRSNGNSFDSTFYPAIAQNDRDCITIRTQQTEASGSSNLETNNRYVWSPSEKEVSGSGRIADSQYTQPPVQLPIFTTQAQRLKSLVGGSAREWWTCDGSGNNGYGLYVTTSGTITGNRGQGDVLGILPCFWLVADS